MMMIWRLQSQKNMEVMTKLQGEEHNSRELQQRSCTQEEELKQLRHLVSDSESFIVAWRMICKMILSPFYNISISKTKQEKCEK